ncbi:MAG: IPT/TIG domain-containing protein, partial [Deltaproteobacteria bacterium]|nr:IPT/TIG domain-containing protein [Deltaproteobacteria bacterium]
MGGMRWLLSLAAITVLWGCPPEETPQPPPPPVPSLASIDPGVGLTAGGDVVTLGGANLSGVTVVAFGTAPGNVTSKTETEIVVTTPPNSRGTVSVKVTAPGGVAELPDAFRYEVGVTIASIEPGTVQANHPTTIAIEGDGFLVADTDPIVRLDTTQLTVVSATSSHIAVQVPSLDEGSYDISVTNADGRSASVTDGLQVLAPIVIGSVTPNWGYSDVTTDVTIRGSGFDGTTAVVFGTLPGTNLNVQDSSTITVTAPASGSSTGSVAVIVRRGIGDEGQLADGFTYYSSDGQLRVLEVRPAVGRSTGGQSVVVWGTGFSSAVHVYFGADEATVTNTAADGRSVTVQTPLHTLGGQLVEEPVAVRATLGGSDVSLTNGFTYYRMPEITQVNPTTLATAGGDTVTIGGAGFMPTGMQVLFDNIAATDITIVSSSELTCISPAHAEGVGLPVAVINKYNDSVTWAGGGVNFVERTRIQSVTPSSISKAGRTFMTLRGTGLAPTAQEMTVTLDGRPVLDLTRVDQNTLT